MGKGNNYAGSCYCGAVQFTVSGEPVAMGYCHCDSCRHWSAGPVNAFTLWKPDAVRITQGAENIGTYNKNPRSYRKWCKSCGGHIFTEHPEWGLTDVYAAVIPELPFRRIRGMRNVLAHDYAGVDLQIVWEVATLHIPALRTVLEQFFTDHT